MQTTPPCKFPAGSTSLQEPGGQEILAVVFDEKLHLGKYKIKLKPQGNTSAQILFGFSPFLPSKKK